MGHYGKNGGFNTMKEALKGCGFHPNNDSRGNRAAPEFPEDYLRGGYFETINGKQNIKREYILDFAEEVTEAIKQGYSQEKGMEFSIGQIRKCFDTCRRIEMKLINNNYDFKTVEGDLARLIPMIRDARARRNVPHILVEFIQKNVSQVKTHQDFLKGFLLHFEAVMANLKYISRK